MIATVPYVFVIGFLYESERNKNSTIHSCHGIVIKRADLRFEPSFVQCAKLFKQDDAVFLKPESAAGDLYMRGQFCLCETACDRSCNNGRRVLVSHIILDDQYRTYTALLAADHRT